MPYRDRLNRWLIVRLLPNMQRITVAAFYNRSDAEGHLQILRRLIPGANFAIVFNADGMATDGTVRAIEGEKARHG